MVFVLRHWYWFELHSDTLCVNFSFEDCHRFQRKATGIESTAAFETNTGGVCD